MENRELPKFHETFIPVLESLSDKKIVHRNDLRIKVRDQHYSDLPKDILKEKTKSGDILILNRIGWGIAYLKQAKMVHQPERGLVQITEKGFEALKVKTLTLEDLKQDSDYLRYEQLKKIKSIDVKNGDVVNSSPQDMIDYGFASIEEEVKNELITKLKEVDPYYFEKVILLLLNKMGYGDFVETKKSGDGGVDGIINQDKLGLEKIYVQAKRYSENKVREKDIRNFIGAMSRDTSKGVFVTTTDFDPKAVEKAKDAQHKIILIDADTLAGLMYEYGVGVQVQNTYEAKDLDEDFFII